MEEKEKEQARRRGCGSARRLTDSKSGFLDAESLAHATVLRKCEVLARSVGLHEHLVVRRQLEVAAVGAVGRGLTDADHPGSPAVAADRALVTGDLLPVGWRHGV
jgi:hypothetical protein